MTWYMDTFLKEFGEVICALCSFSQLDRHLRRVDQDLSRFTIELEADTAGITEILEQSEE